MARRRANRREGGRRLLFSLLAVGVVFAVVSARLRSPLRQILMTPVHYVQGALGTSVDGMGRLVATVAAQWSAGRENAILRRRLRDTESQLAQVQAQLLAARRRLEGLTAGFAERTFPSVVADVIAGDASPWRESIVVAAGSRSGVRRNMPVIWSGGVVGRVVSVGPLTSRVLLLTDPAFRAAVRFVRTGVRGVLAGAGAGRCRVDFVAHDADVREGDALVSAGIDGVFPANLYVGTCAGSSAGSGELTLRIDARPHTKARDLETVEILLWQPPEEPPGALPERSR